jgi:hypothetical protein
MLCVKVYSGESTFTPPPQEEKLESIDRVDQIDRCPLHGAHVGVQPIQTEVLLGPGVSDTFQTVQHNPAPTQAHMLCCAVLTLLMIRGAAITNKL